MENPKKYTIEVIAKSDDGLFEALTFASKFIPKVKAGLSCKNTNYQLNVEIKEATLTFTEK